MHNFIDEIYSDKFMYKTCGKCNLTILVNTYDANKLYGLTLNKGIVDF